MSTDIQNTYADKEVWDHGATPALFNFIDHGGVNGRGGPSRGLFLEIVVTTTLTGSTGTLVFELHEADNATFTQNDTVIGSWTASAPGAPAGEIVAQVAMPTVNRRYTRIEATHTGSAATGAVSAYLTTDPQASFAGS